MSVTYNLGWFDKKNKNVLIKGDREITHDEYIKIGKSAEILSYVAVNYNYFEMMIKNVDEVLGVISAFEQKIDTFMYNTEMTPYVKELNRTFINALGSFLCFLNHYEYILKTKFADDEIVARFKKICNEYFDNYFEYRFFYKLRNYVVHCNIPVSLLESNQDVIRYTFYIDVKNLLKEFDWGKIVKNDLERLNSNIEVKDLITRVLNMLYKLNKDVILLDAARISDALSYLKNFVKIDDNRGAQMPIIIIEDSNDFEKLEIKSFGDNYFVVYNIYAKLSVGKS